MSNRAAIAARILIEERFAWVHASLGMKAAELASKPISDGGLGKHMRPSTVRARLWSYEEKRARRLAEAREEERERLVAEAEYAVVDADKRLAGLAAAGDGAGYSSGLRAYDRAEAVLERRRTEHVPLARWMRESDEVDAALLTMRALRFTDARDRAHLMRSLNLTEPLGRLLG